MSHTTKSASTLMTALSFTADDLAANREGHLSDRQRAYLDIDRRKNGILGTVMVVALVFAVTALLFVGLRDGNLILTVLGGVLLVVNITLSLFFTLNWVRMSYDLRTDTTEVIEGAAQHVVRQAGKAKAASVRIGETIEVPTGDVDTFKAFEPGVTYRLYRTTHTGRLLSVERVG
jgi:hypothetical protein